MEIDSVSDAAARFPRRCLLMTVGRTPQVVTETVYALAVKPDGRRFVPTEIHLVTTEEGRRQAELDLLERGQARLSQLCCDYGLERAAIRFDVSTIHVIHDDAGAPLEDIRTVQDNERGADAIVRLVRQLTADADCALHVSLAGGRKTMGFYLGYALSLFGRPQDRLSHVLVDPRFENLPEFFYPTPASRILRLRDGKGTVDAQQARIDLAEIPVVSLRGLLGAELLGNDDATYAEIVRRARGEIGEAPTLKLDLGHHVATCGGREVRFSAGLFAWYCWFAFMAKQGESRVDWRKVSPASLSRVADQLEGPRLGRLKFDAWLDGETLDKDALDRNRSRINKTLDQTLGPGPARPYRIVRSGKKTASLYGLDLLPEQIEFVR